MKTKKMTADPEAIAALGGVPRLGECTLTQHPVFEKTFTVRVQATADTGYMTLKTIVDMLRSIGATVELPERYQ